MQYSDLRHRAVPFVFIVCLTGLGAGAALAETEDGQPFSYRRELINRELSQQEMLGVESRGNNTGAADRASASLRSPGEAGTAAAEGFQEAGRKPPRISLERDKAVTQAMNRVEMGLESFGFNYNEPSVMKDRGVLTGVYGIYTHWLSDNRHIKTLKDAWRDKLKVNKFSFEGRFVGGDVNYKSEETGTRDGLNFYMFELRGLLAYEMPIIPSGAITPFFGVGFRYLKDDGGGKVSSTNHWFYDRESRYF
nr:hypothetical protein [Candidatus Omnitrophota bacterium]